MVTSGMTSTNISFYAMTGAEIHWRQAASLKKDTIAVKTLSAGWLGMVIVEVLLIVGSYFTTPYLYNAVGCVSGVIGLLVDSIRTRVTCWKKRKTLPDPEEDGDSDGSDLSDNEDVDVDGSSGYDPLDSIPLLNDSDQNTQHSLSKQFARREHAPSLLKRSLVLSAVALMLILRCVRPADSSYQFLSRTLVLTPFGGTPRLDLSWLPGDYQWTSNRTALDVPPRFDWPLPIHNPGFRDWNATAHHLHYNPAKDPLNLSNLHLPVLEPLREALSNGSVPIKHVFVIKLESTREDVFPLRNQSYILNRIRQSYNGQTPPFVEANAASLTPTAERLTGMSSGFGWRRTNRGGEGPSRELIERDVHPYGGIHATNSYTSSTYTLKSLVGTLCGVSPLVVDFNREFSHHIYQPCLAHILEAMNARSRMNNATDDFTTWPWHSAYMQSVTEEYDNQDRLTPAMGYRHIVDDQTIRKDHPDLNRPKEGRRMNFLGFPDTELRPYLQRILTRAENKRERLFLTHLTGISHFPWKMLRDKYDELIHPGSLGNDRLNRYLNTIGFADRWLGEILELLEKHGVANETLLVITGDQ